MGYAIATVTGGSGDEAHYKVLAAIRTLALANGWTELRYVNTGVNRELILHSSGLSGTEDIYIGFRTYSNVTTDLYNIEVAVMTGYVAANVFSNQPGFKSSGVPCHNNAVTYYLCANAQRIFGMFKVGTPVFAHFYAGKFFPYARPTEYPAALYVGGHFNGPEEVRYSDLTRSFPYYGYAGWYSYGGTNNQNITNQWIRDPAGVWRKTWCLPWMYPNTFANARPADAAGQYYMPQACVQITMDSAGSNDPSMRGWVWGELDGITQCTGFNSTAENVMQIGGSSTIDQTGMTPLEAVDAIRAVGGRAFVVGQDMARTAFFNYVLMEMS